MRWIKFTASGRTSWGIVEGDRIDEIQGDPFAVWERANRQHALADVRIELPLIPRTFYCAGLNYRHHIEEAAARAGKTPTYPQRPDMGYRAQGALIAHDEDVVIPRDATENVQYEGELVVVIGKKAKHLTEADAMSCVFGYSIGNDVSERSWHLEDRTPWRAKNADTFKPMGPWIETTADREAMRTIVRVNGRVDSDFRTNNMIFSIEAHLIQLTRHVTVWPGDVIWMGTDGTPCNVKADDVVEIEITGVGTLRNRFVAES